MPLPCHQRSRALQGERPGRTTSRAVCVSFHPPFLSLSVEPYLEPAFSPSLTAEEEEEDEGKRVDITMHKEKGVALGLAISGGADTPDPDLGICISRKREGT